MSAVAARQMHWTEEQYLAFENESATKHEFYDGEVYAMAGAKPVHNLICGNAIAALHGLLKGRPCGVFTSDQRIHIAAPGGKLKYTYPDAGVLCGKGHYAPKDPDGEMSLMNPVLLVEVLSPSTKDYDRGEKLAHYKSISTLMEVLHIWTERRLVEQHVRQGVAWHKIDLATGFVSSLHGALSIEDLYHMTDVQ